MMHGAESKKIVVFLDYDGTLSPIVNDPDVAFMTDKVNKKIKDKITWKTNAVKCKLKLQLASRN